MMEDAELIRRTQQGCEEAFADLVRRYADRLHRFLVGRGANPVDAEDLVQETFIAAHRALDRYDPRYAFSTWLFTIGRRLAVSQYRKRKRLEAIAEKRIPPPSGTDSRSEAGQGIWDAARQKLAPRDFEALWLRYGEDLSIGEVARVMGVYALHARVILHRARGRLAAELHAAGTLVGEPRLERGL